MDDAMKLSKIVQDINDISSHTPISIACACILSCVDKHKIEKIDI